MFTKEKLAAAMGGQDPVSESSPVAYALFRMAIAIDDPAAFSAALTQMNNAGRKFAHMDGSQAMFVIQRKGGMALSVAELAGQMSPEQWDRWVGEAPGMAKQLAQANAKGNAGGLLNFLTLLGRKMGKGEEILKTMLVAGDLAWKDDGLGQHQTVANVTAHDLEELRRRRGLGR
jgi:hypothetical protein